MYCMCFVCCVWRHWRAQDMENKIRNTLREIYFGKTNDIVHGLRSTVPLTEMKQREFLQNDLAAALRNRSQQSWALLLTECVYICVCVCACVQQQQVRACTRIHTTGSIVKRRRRRRKTWYKLGRRRRCCRRHCLLLYVTCQYYCADRISLSTCSKIMCK